MIYKFEAWHSAFLHQPVFSRVSGQTFQAYYGPLKEFTFYIASDGTNPPSDATYKPFLWKFDPTIKKVVGIHLYTADPIAVPPVPNMLSGDFAAITTTFGNGVELLVGE